MALQAENRGCREARAAHLFDAHYREELEGSLLALQMGEITGGAPSRLMHYPNPSVLTRQLYAYF
jgi:hypothetical protein